MNEPHRGNLISLRSLTKSLPLCLSGLRNLQLTYADDAKTTDRITPVIQKLNKTYESLLTLGLKYT